MTAISVKHHVVHVLTEFGGMSGEAIFEPFEQHLRARANVPDPLRPSFEYFHEGKKVPSPLPEDSIVDRCWLTLSHTQTGATESVVFTVNRCRVDLEHSVVSYQDAASVGAVVWPFYVDASVLAREYNHLAKLVDPSRIMAMSIYPADSYWLHNTAFGKAALYVDPVNRDEHLELLLQRSAAETVLLREIALSPCPQGKAKPYRRSYTNT